MQTPYRVADDTFVLPSKLPIPGHGLLYLNAMVIKSKEPVLVDTGAPAFREEYLQAVCSLVEPQDIRWIYLSHDDHRDHSGNLMPLLELCPHARVVTNFIGAGRLSEEWSLPMERVKFVNDGDRFSAGDRMLTAIRSPLFDSPATRGLWDPKSQVYFSADSFGAYVPHVCEDIDDIDAETFEHGFNWFNRANHPWHEYVDLEKFLPLVERIRRLHSKVIVSYHAPAARNRSEQLCRMISAIPAMERLSLPQQEELEAMLAAS